MLGAFRLKELLEQSMIQTGLKRFYNVLLWIRFQIGEFFFPLMEPLFRTIENRDPETKKHFLQALQSLEKQKVAITLLNLNMVLSLNPKHFPARVYRGRIYAREGRTRLASEDYLQANRISRYRFTHYSLYSEYFQFVNKEFGELGSSIVKNFNQVFEALKNNQDKLGRKGEIDESTEAFENFSSVDGDLDEDVFLNSDDEVLTEEEHEKFKSLGPITQKEIDETNWDKLISKLKS